MTINHEKKLIFIHIPKNAGTSIIKAMECEKNYFIDKSIEEYKERYQDYWDTYIKFTVIRNPICRFISAYKFARMNESGWFSITGQEGLEKHIHYELCNSMNINEYVEYIFNNPKEFNRWIIPQTFIISNKDKKIEIDYFVKYENLLKDLKNIGIDTIKILNKSKIDDISKIILNKNSIKKLHKIYEIDYKNFYSEKFKKTFNYY
jgi:hypothetical protein